MRKEQRLGTARRAPTLSEGEMVGHPERRSNDGGRSLHPLHPDLFVSANVLFTFLFLFWPARRDALC
jgi:hypothetical protein